MIEIATVVILAVVTGAAVVLLGVAVGLLVRRE